MMLAALDLKLGQGMRQGGLHNGGFLVVQVLGQPGLGALPGFFRFGFVDVLSLDRHIGHDRDALCRMLGVDPLKLNTDICRLRKQLGELGVRGAPGIVQRRAGSGQVRIGVGRLEIARA